MYYFSRAQENRMESVPDELYKSLPLLSCLHLPRKFSTELEFLKSLWGLGTEEE
jgi:hypothetical protein